MITVVNQAKNKIKLYTPEGKFKTYKLGKYKKSQNLQHRTVSDFQLLKQFIGRQENVDHKNFKDYYVYYNHVELMALQLLFTYTDEFRHDEQVFKTAVTTLLDYKDEKLTRDELLSWLTTFNETYGKSYKFKISAHKNRPYELENTRPLTIQIIHKEKNWFI